MFVDTDKLIKGYFDLIKDQYPNLTLPELTLMCRSPFLYLRQQWKDIKLPTIRFMHFGTFVVKPGTLAGKKLKLEKVEAAGGSPKYIEKTKAILNQKTNEESTN